MSQISSSRTKKWLLVAGVLALLAAAPVASAEAMSVTIQSVTTQVKTKGSQGVDLGRIVQIVLDSVKHNQGHH
jgi:hypothetical protein